MYICTHCGKLVEYEELGTYVEPYGEVHKDYTCACCGHELEKAIQCKVCGTWIELANDERVCDVCVEKYSTVGTALEIGKDYPVKVNVNEFIAKVLSEEQIDKILTKWVEENFVDHSTPVVEYCAADRTWFEEYIVEKADE